jgi:glycosyltransferase involved in cell wall biosynthesis
MNIVVVSAKFDPAGRGGSDVFQHGFFTTLASRGNTVTVHTVAATSFEPEEAFGLRWRDNQPAGRHEDPSGYQLWRHRVSFNAPRYLTHLFSKWILKRWQQEDRKEGEVLPGSERFAEMQYARAMRRPRIYGWLAALGLGPWSFGLLGSVARALRQADIVIVTYFPFAALMVPAFLARLHGVPVVQIPLFHSEDRYHYFRPLLSGLRRSAAILALSPASASLFEKLFGAPKVQTLGIGVSDDFLAKPASAPSQRLLKLRERSRALILMVGRKEPSKNYSLVTQALADLGLPDVNLRMVGRDVDRQPIPASNVTLIQDMDNDELRHAYEMCDFLVFPSQHESFGIVIIEAWAAGKPVIASRFCAAVSTIVDDGVNGLLCRGLSDWRTAIERLIRSSDERKALGQNGRRKVSELFVWDRVAHRAENLMSETVHAGDASAAV